MSRPRRITENPCIACGAPRPLKAQRGRRCKRCDTIRRAESKAGRLARSGLATCHPNRAAGPGGLCRECAGLAVPDDPLPAQIVGVEQHASATAPARCPKCGAAWDASGLYAICHTCGATWHRTSARRLPAPGNSTAIERALAAFNGRRDPEGGRAAWGGITPYRDEDSS